MRGVLNLRVALAASLVLNGMLAVLFWGRILLPASLTPGLEAVTFGVDEKSGEYFRLRFGTAMDTAEAGAGPVVFYPRLPHDVVWLSAREALCIPRQPLVPGKAYAIRPVAGLRDAGAVSLADDTLMTQTAPLKVLEVGVAEQQEASRTRVSFRFNGPVAAKQLADFLSVVDPTGRKLTVKAARTQPAHCPTVSITHPSGTRRFAVRIRPGLMASGADHGLAKSFEATVETSADLTIGPVTAGSDSAGLYIQCVIPGAISGADLCKGISLSPEAEFTVRPQNWGGRYRLVGHFRPRTFYRVTFLKGLRTTDGRVLGKGVGRAVVTGDLSPVLEFMSRGPILPKGATSELPFRVCSPQDVRFTATRIFPNNLVAFVRDGVYSADRNGVLAGGLLWHHGVPGDRSGVGHLPLNRLIQDGAHGVYLVQGALDQHHWPRTSRVVAWTDLALSAAFASDAADVWVRRLSDNAAVEDGTVRVLSYQNQLLGQGTTDRTGHVRIPFEPGAGTAYLVTASRDGDLSVLQAQTDRHDLTQFAVAGRAPVSGGYEAFVYTERGICRPGETVYLSGLVRDAALTAVPGMPVEIVVSDPTGHALTTELAELDCDGFFNLPLDLPPRCRTGNYTVTVGLPGGSAAAGVWGTASFRVGAFVPDRLRASLKLDRETYASGDKATAELRAAYYYGAPARRHRTVLRTTFSPVAFRPAGYEGYTFGNGDRGWPARTGPTRKTDTDETGRATWDIPLPETLRPPAAIRLAVVGTALEHGGRGVSASAEAVLHPYAYYLGLRTGWDGVPPTDSLTFPWVAVSPAGEPMRPAGTLTYEMWRDVWNYELTQDRDGNYTYRWSQERVAVSKGAVELDGDTANGSLSLPLPEPGAYVLVVSGEHGAAEALLRFYLSYGDGGGSRPTHQAYLGIESDRPAYVPGSAAQVTFRTPWPGVAQLCVGDDRVRQVHSVAVQPGANTVSVDVPSTPFGSVHVAVTAIADAPAPARGPRRLFGLARLDIEQAAHHLDVTLDLPPQARPGDSLPVTVHLARSGATTAGRVQVLAVDEGILAVTAYRTPDPFAFFHGIRRCALEFSDVYDHVFPDLAQAGRTSAVGGGGFARFTNSLVPEQLAAAVVVLPPISVPETGSATFNLELPDHTGALRVMAVAFDRTSVGSAAGALRLQRELNVQVTAPRALAPGDQFDVTAHISNEQIDVANISVEMTVEGPVAMADTRPVSLKLAKGKDGLVRFHCVAQTPTGGASMTVTATAAETSTTQRATLSVRPPSPAVFRAEYCRVNPGNVLEIKFPDRWLGGTCSVRGQVATSATVEVAPAINWLRRYPYGCLEQTVSAAFPLVCMAALAEPAGAPHLDDRALVAGEVALALQRLALMELPQGGFGTWPGSGLWRGGSVYAAHFLISAKTAGFTLDDVLLVRTRDFLRSMLYGNHGECAREDRAYVLYLLSLYGSPEPGIAEGLMVDAQAPPFVRLLAAAALVNGGQARRGAEELRNIRIMDCLQDDFVWDMDSPTRRVALALCVLLDVDPEAPDIPRLVAALRRQKSASGHWGSTQNNAMAVLALGKWAAMNRGQRATRARVTEADGSVTEVAFGEPFRFAGAEAPAAIAVRGLGPGPVYCSWSVAGVPLEPQVEPVVQGISVQRRYLAEAGTPANAFSQGDLVRVELRMETPVQRRNVAVVDLLPGGLEIEDASLDTRWAPGEKARNMSVQYIDRQDDRLVLFCNLGGGDKASVFTYTARAVSRGRFVTPRVCAEAMYDPEVRAESGRPETIVIR